MGEYLALVTDVGFPIVASLAGGYFVFLTLSFILDGVLDDIKQQRMFSKALDNRVKTMNNEIIRIDLKMCKGFWSIATMDAWHPKELYCSHCGTLNKNDRCSCGHKIGDCDCKAGCSCGCNKRYLGAY